MKMIKMIYLNKNIVKSIALYSEYKLVILRAVIFLKSFCISYFSVVNDKNTITRSHIWGKENVLVYTSEKEGAVLVKRLGCRSRKLRGCMSKDSDLEVAHHQ